MTLISPLVAQQTLLLILLSEVSHTDQAAQRLDRLPYPQIDSPAVCGCQLAETALDGHPAVGN